MPRWTTILAGALLAACAAQPSPTVVSFADTGSTQQKGIGTGSERIEFIGEFSSPSELGYKAGFSARFKRFLGGGQEARLVRPYAIDTLGDVLVIADPGAGQVVSIDAKRRRYNVIGASDTQEFSSPVGVALADEYLYVADSALGKVFKFDREQRLVQTLDQFERPTSLIYDHAARQLYVADTATHTISVIDAQDNTLRQLGSRGSARSQFNYPTHMALVGETLLVVDALNFRVQVFSVDGVFLDSFGIHGDQPGQLAQPKGIAADRDGHIYIAESVSGKIQIFDLAGAFMAAFGSYGDGAGSFTLPAGIHIEGDRIYVADSGNGRIQIFRYLEGGG